MWVVRLAHPTVNRFRVIAEHTREAAEQEAANQIKAWDYRGHSRSCIKRRETLAGPEGYEASPVTGARSFLRYSTYAA